MSSKRFLAAMLLVHVVAAASQLRAQPLTHRTPNMQGTWVTSPWNLYFGFNHRFRIINDSDITDIFDEAFVKNSPTFDLALGLWSPFMVGVKYATEPAIINGTRNNEWFPYLKWAPLRRDDWSASLQGGYDTQAESFDGELAGQATIARRIEALGAVRGFTDALHTGEGGVALAGGLGIRITNYIVLAGDIAGFVVKPDSAQLEQAGYMPDLLDDVAWSAGIQLGIPFTPHTFSLQVTNSSSTMLQAASFNSLDSPSVAGDGVAWGFEFTVPFSGFARWGRIFDQPADEGPQAAGVIEIDMKRSRLAADTIRVPAGSAVRWVNRDPIAHTTAADDGEWKSWLLGPGETYTTLLEEPGTYRYSCTLHPHMDGVIVVEPEG
jgi:plastocyanin